MYQLIRILTCNQSSLMILNEYLNKGSQIILTYAHRTGKIHWREKIINNKTLRQVWESNTITFDESLCFSQVKGPLPIVSRITLRAPSKRKPMMNEIWLKGFLCRHNEFPWTKHLGKGREKLFHAEADRFGKAKCRHRPVFFIQKGLRTGLTSNQPRRKVNRFRGGADSENLKISCDLMGGIEHTPKTKWEFAKLTLAR